ncbi:hypothetical protein METBISCDRAFT_22136 [Metschnikowia bicuspidata]|uniref:Uncharacterized protein n=1 Tax=Metschnikowia bicuspidata TaxID=27322 RepID=A0A4P9ZF71_9ASCO|nr:hypothetical protein METBISCDRAFT_22136 [Metschnikowia bicuspidata]
MARDFVSLNLPVLHLFAITCWIVLRLFQAVDSHSGYDFPWSLQHFSPFWTGAAHHDLHHHFIGNYSSSFRLLDLFLGTESGPKGKYHREQESSPSGNCCKEGHLRRT